MRNKAAQGTTLHPSVYLIFDEYSNVFLDSKALSFRSDIEMLRSTVLTKDVFWGERETVDIEEPGAIRILVCGNTGVGKSTLINEVFGAEVVRHAYRRCFPVTDRDTCRPMRRTAHLEFTISRIQ